MNISLREVTLDDAELILKWRLSDKVNNFMNSDVLNDLDRQKQWISDSYDKGHYYHWIILQEKLPIGLINIQNYSKKNKTASWGFYIGEENLDGHYGGFIPPIFYNWVFKTLGVTKINIEVFFNNINVIKMHQQHGYKFTPKLDRVIHKKNKDVLLVGMSLNSNDWNYNRYKKFQKIFPVNNWLKKPKSID